MEDTLPNIDDILSISQMVSNNVQYLSKTKRLPSGRWAAIPTTTKIGESTETILPGMNVAVPNKSRKGSLVVPYNTIPKTVRKIFTALRNNDVFTTTGPVFSVAPEYK